MIKEIKSIPLASFLSSLGHEPAKRSGTKLWYKSPVRQENTPSFKVETTINCWYDFGLGKGGNIIDLARMIYRSDDLSYVLRCIVRHCPIPTSQTVAPLPTPRHTAPGFQNIEIVALQRHALLAYLKERGISPQIAQTHCQEAHYSLNGKRYYSVAFRNIAGGYELRNRYFNGCLSSKNISLRRIRDGPSTEIAVFEGFIDYLSALTLGIISGTDAIILNSVCNVNKAMSYLTDYRSIYCYLDNDIAGKSATSELVAKYGVAVIDRSNLYDGFNDLNEYLQHSIISVNTSNSFNSISHPTKTLGS